MRWHWIAQFYEAISLKFCLKKYSNAWKMTYSSLKLSWNDFKVKYAWIEVKKFLWKNLGVNGSIEWRVWRGSKICENAQNLAKIRVFGCPYNPTQWLHWPQILSVETFWLQYKHILVWNHFKIIWDWKMSIFTHRYTLLSKNLMKSHHKIERSSAISVLKVEA